MRSWPTLALAAEAAAVDELEEWLLAAAAELPDGCYRGARIETGREAMRLVASFADAGSRDDMARAARAAFPGLAVECSQEPDRDWVAEVAASEVAVPLGRRFAALPGAAPALPGREGIWVPRSRAFGTGEHASTRLAAALLEERLAPGAGLLDLGAGTALLAVLGERLGARPVLAVDVDEDACRVARGTLAAADGSRVALVCGTTAAVRPRQPFATVVANIERDVLVAEMPALLRLLRPGGSLILSGLLVGQLDAVAAAAAAFDGVELERRSEGEWGALVLTRRPAARPRALCPGLAPDAAGTIDLPQGEAHHLARVRRLAAGDVVEVLDGAGRAWFGRLGGAGSRLQVVACRPLPAATEAGLRLTLAAAVLDESGRMEILLRHAVELGAAAVQPLLSERCQGRRHRRGWPLERWRRVVAESVKQSGRVLLPAVREPLTLAELTLPAGAVGIVLDPAGSEPSALAAQAPREAVLVVGPEGGLTPAESARLAEQGWQRLRLGPRILRSETAAATGMAVLMAVWGDLGSGLS